MWREGRRKESSRRTPGIRRKTGREKKFRRPLEGEIFFLPLYVLVHLALFYATNKGTLIRLVKDDLVRKEGISSRSRVFLLVLMKCDIFLDISLGCWGSSTTSPARTRSLPGGSGGLAHPLAR